MRPTRRFHGLRLFWKLLVPFATLLVIVGAFGAFVLIRDQASRAQSHLNQSLQEVSLQVRGVLQQRELYLLESANLAANLQGMANAVASGDSNAVEQLLRSVVALKGELTAVGVISSDGTPMVTVGPSGEPATIRFDATSTLITSTLNSTTGAKQASFVPDPRGDMLAIAAPICSAPDPCMPTGTAIVTQSLTTPLVELASGELAERLGGGGLAVFDGDGRLLARYGSGPERAQDVDAGASQLLRVVDEVDGEQLQTLYAPYRVQGEARGTVAVTLASGPEFAALRGTGLRLTILLALALAGIVVVGALVSRAILRQVGPLVETNRRLGAGELSARVPVVSGDEIGQVAQGLNLMAEQLQASYQTLESQVEQRTAEIRRLLEHRTEFFASLSHELRTPLAIILSQSDLLLLDDNEPEVSETGRAIRQSAAQLLGVVDEILELARAEAGNLEVRAEPLLLARFAEELAPTMQGLARAGDIDLTTTIADTLPPVSADPHRLREILINLVDNAVKYSPAGTQVEISATPDDDHVVIAVTDNGPGIPPDVGHRLFEPFYRVNGTRPREGHASSGLGLALTRRLVEAHGGTITYQSTPEAGTTFRFALPVASRTETVDPVLDRT